MLGAVHCREIADRRAELDGRKIAVGRKLARLIAEQARHPCPMVVVAIEAAEAELRALEADLSDLRCFDVVGAPELGQSGILA